MNNGDDAANIAAANAGAVLAAPDDEVPNRRMERAISEANHSVFQRFSGQAGTVLVAALIENKQVVIGWVGDARAYGVRDIPPASPELLTQDDTVAGDIARIEGPAPDAMDTLVRAIGLASTVKPHVKCVTAGYEKLVLLSDGVYRIDSSVLHWICRHGVQISDLVKRLVAAASWEGGVDNATALAIDLNIEPRLEETGVSLNAWIGDQPRIWQLFFSEPPRHTPPRMQQRDTVKPTPFPPGHSRMPESDSKESEHKVGRTEEKNKRRRRKDTDQASLAIEIGTRPKTKQ